MRPEDCELVAQLCASRVGLRVDPEKIYPLESRLNPVARREGFGSVPDLLAALRARREERLMWAIVEAMAAGETSFFRDRKPFDFFAEEVLPKLASLRESEPIRIWSAACASGQEVYSLAMIIDDLRAKIPGAQAELFASDLSERALEKAQSGLYTQFEIQRGLPIRHVLRHFEKVGEMWLLSPRIRQMVRWRRLNLVAETPGAGRFDVIFCRNVLSTLVEPARQRLLENLAQALAPDGFLFLGTGETAEGLTDALQPVAEHSGIHIRNPAVRAAA
jgi:chemotaxis protein methyltransferase CheR